MATLWIGDFRTKQLQQNTAQAELQTSQYLTDDFAEYSWFNSTAVTQLPLLSLESANVVILLGLIDCVYSCTWDAFSINQIVSNYTKNINELIVQYPSLKFYICSVNPVDSDYPFIDYTDAIIPKKTLNDKIEQFNNKIKVACAATYIDSYKYLTSTGFTTRDGIRFTPDTCIALQNYIENVVGSKQSTTTFMPRLSAPDLTIEDDLSELEDSQAVSDVNDHLYWISQESGGLNPYPVVDKATGSTLPSNTAYAWGRFGEILGDTPKLSQANAEYWYLAVADGYSRGATPALGAVACWQKNVNGATSGYVAIVEKINTDGSIETSESNSSKLWTLVTRKKGEDSRWGMDSSFTFQGFIYNPIITPTANMTTADKTAVISKNEALTSSEMKINAEYIWNYLGSRGWSLNAVAGMLGNMQSESTINPGRHQVGGGSGFGLVQWTPSTNLTDWCDKQTPKLQHDDIDSQLKRIIWEKENGEQYKKNHYKYTFEEFSTSLDSPYTLACAFAFDYERSNVVLRGTESEKEALRKRRGNAAEEWYNFLAPYAQPNSSFEEKFILDNFKVDKLASTEVKASFIVKNGDSGRYKLFNSAGKELINKKLSVTADNNLNTISFACNEKIIPNASYKLSIEVADCIGGSTRSKSKTFKTPQDYPNSIEAISLTAPADAYRSSKTLFTLNITKPDYLGYWKNNCGYDMQLIVNNQCVKTITNRIADINWKNFSIKEKFGYTCKTGDNIQIGVRVWVKDNNGKKVYNLSGVKTSKPICLLNKPVITYLNLN